jgi:hypothetical protein
MNSHSGITILYLITLVCHCAAGQQQTGTIVVLSITRDKAIVAADSREMNGTTNTVANDSDCKILALDKKAIFAFSGLRLCEMRDSKRVIWDAQGVARDTYRHLAEQPKRVGESMGNKFIRAWDKAMLQTMDFKLCNSTTGPHGEVMTAVFLDVDPLNGTEAYFDAISSENATVNDDIAQIEPNGLPMGTGHTNILNEFLAGVTPRSKTWHATIDKYSPERRVQALAQLTRRFDTSGFVGGNIDMAVLTTNGIQWVSTKKQCQPQQH